VKIRVVAGEYDGVSGPVTEIAAKPTYMDVTLDPGVAFSLPVEIGHQVVAYLFEGMATFGPDDETLVEAVKMLVFGESGEFRVRADKDSHARFMLMAGGPFGEPIAPYGPFVMNTQEEIMQAFAELRAGTFVKD
jgi:redox-sensitive bicupin YhaK (pirin superfamily)